MSLVKKVSKVSASAQPETPETEHPMQINPSNAEVEKLCQIGGFEYQAPEVRSRGFLSSVLNRIMVEWVETKTGKDFMEAMK